MIVHARFDQVRHILGAMRKVANAGGDAPLAPGDRVAIEAAYRYVFKGTDAVDVDALPAPSPAELAAAYRRALARVRAGEPALIDVVSQPR